MSETESKTNGPDAADMPERLRLSFDLDVDIAVVGAGLAGLTVALEAARLGASVAVLEGRHVGWDASGHQLGTVMPGYDLPLSDLIARIGFEDTRELWSLSKQGAEYVRTNATEELIPGIALSEGALEVSHVEAGDQLIARLQMLGEDFETEVEGWQVDRVRAELRTDHYFHGADLRGHAGRQHRSIRHSQAHRYAVGAAACIAHRARRQHPSRRAAAAVVGNVAAGLALCRGDRAARRAPCRDDDVSG